MSYYADDTGYGELEMEYPEIKCTSCKSPNLLCIECGAYWESCSCQSSSSDLVCMGCSQVITPDDLLDMLNDIIDEEESEQLLLFDEEQMSITDSKPKCSCIPENKYFCGKCQVTRSDPKDPWKKVTTPTGPKNSVLNTTSKYPAKSSGTYANKSYTGPDRHYGVSIDLGNGVIVHPSSMNNERNKDNKSQVVPDFGLYADYGWRPTWRNEMINWPDYGIPKVYETASDQIIDAYNRAVDGQYVEFGCIGGHGRTGTILGCMKMLAERTSNNDSFTYKDAIKWVRTKYCDHAIESDMQEWFIGWFDHHNYDTALPEKPEQKPKSYGGGWSSSANSSGIAPCSAVEHLAMREAGWEECAKNPGQCKWWEQDAKDSLDPTKEQQVAANKKSAESKGLIVKYKTELEAVLKYSDCKIEAHYAMWQNGFTNCCEYGSKCVFFGEDTEDFKNNKSQVMDKDKIAYYLKKYPKPQPTNQPSNRNNRKNRRNRRNRGRK